MAFTTGKAGSRNPSVPGIFTSRVSRLYRWETVPTRASARARVSVLWSLQEVQAQSWGHGSLALLTPVTAWPIFPGFLRQHWGLRRLLPCGQGLGHPPGFKLSNFIHVRFSLKQFSIPYESPPKSLETQPFFPPCIGFSKNVKSL